MATSEQPGTNNALSSDEQPSTDDCEPERTSTVHDGMVMILLSREELRKLGYAPDELDKVQHRVMNGGVLIEPAE